MKKIKFLHGFVIGLIVIYIIIFFTNIYLAVYPPSFMNFPQSFYDNFIFGYYTQFVVLVFSIVTFTVLLFVQNGLSNVIKNTYFNNISALKFRKGGVFFLISGFLNFSFHIAILFYSKSEFMLGLLGGDLLLLIIGYSLYVVADIIQNGSFLKKENELTI